MFVALVAIEGSALGEILEASVDFTVKEVGSAVNVVTLVHSFVSYHVVFLREALSAYRAFVFSLPDGFIIQVLA